MAERIIWSLRAKEDRKKILEFWIKHTGNNKYSLKLRKEFNDLIRHLLVFPDLGKKVHDFDARCLIKGEYKIFYEVNKYQNDTEISILHIWDTRRNPDDLNVS